MLLSEHSALGGCPHVSDSYLSAKLLCIKTGMMGAVTVPCSSSRHSDVNVSMCVACRLQLCPRLIRGDGEPPTPAKSESCSSGVPQPSCSHMHADCTDKSEVCSLYIASIHRRSYGISRYTDKLYICSVQILTQIGSVQMHRQATNM